MGSFTYLKNYAEIQRNAFMGYTPTVNSIIVKLTITYPVMVFGRCSHPEGLTQLFCIHDYSSSIVFNEDAYWWQLAFPGD